MENPGLSRRKEFAKALLSELKDSYDRLLHVSSEVERTSGCFYEEAYKEKHEELDSVMDSYSRNADRIREINDEITASINSWYEFVKDESQTGKITFPVAYLRKKRFLKKRIAELNGEVSSITIDNRFIREKLTMLEHQLEIKAAGLAKSGESYVEYEKLLSRQKYISAELGYLLPTIPGICPADISPEGIDELLAHFT